MSSDVEPVRLVPDLPQPRAITDEVNYWEPSVWNYVQLGWGCVRFDTKSESGQTVAPRLHMNTAHNTCGIRRVYVDWQAHTNERDLLFETEGGGMIGTMFVLPDETMTGMGVTCGVSGGQPRTACRLYLNGKRVGATDVKLYHPNANLWCFWLWAKNGPSPILEALRTAEVLITELRQRITRLELRVLDQQTPA